MTCQQLDGFLLDYVDGQLPADTLREFEGHLAICPACVDYLRTYRETIRAGKAALAPGPGDSVPADVPEELVQAILAARRRARSGGR